MGGAERAGAIIVTVARVLRIHAGLPKNLANELVCTAAKLVNITPTKSIDWRTPQEMVTDIRPDLSRLRVIGSRGFVLNKHLPRGDKLEDRTFEGFLVGYDASNIFRVWLPNTNRVIRVRDVRFIDELYKDKPSTIPTEPHIIEAVHVPEEEHVVDTIVISQPIRQRQELTTPVRHTSKDVQQLPSPRDTPDPHDKSDSHRTPSPDLVEQQLFQELYASTNSPQTTPGGWNFEENGEEQSEVMMKTVDTHEVYVSDRRQNNAPQHRNPDVSQENIITGIRRHQAQVTYIAMIYLLYRNTGRI